MESSGSGLFSSLFWRIAGVFLIVFVLFAATSLYVAIDGARMYEQEVSQQLNWDLAQHTVKEIKPFLEGEVTEESIGTLMHSMMAINPTVEVYLLDPEGVILKQVAFEDTAKMTRVPLEPIKGSLQGGQEGVMLGTDPRNPDEKKIFSAAEVVSDSGELQGYVYIILAGQDYAGVSDMLFKSHFMKITMRLMLLALALTLLVGMIAIYWITKNLKKLSAGFERFRKGDLSTRINYAGSGEMSRMADTFNDMAGTIERNIEDLKGVDQLRKELIGNVSHDLRTPIASIQGYAETLLMKDDALSVDERTEYLQTIVNSSARLKTLVNDLFELSKLEAGQIELDMEPMSLGELVHDVVGKFRLIASEKGINVNTVLAQDLPIVQVDVQKIDRVLQNLIDNAIKFCKQGDQVNIQLDANDIGAVQVRISDTGAGIPKADLPHIFDRYFKSGRSSNAGGTGLGLAIVKRIVELHGSSIDVKSQVDQGTTFSFELPAMKAA